MLEGIDRCGRTQCALTDLDPEIASQRDDPHDPEENRVSSRRRFQVLGGLGRSQGGRRQASRLVPAGPGIGGSVWREAPSRETRKIPSPAPGGKDTEVRPSPFPRPTKSPSRRPARAAAGFTRSGRTGPGRETAPLFRALRQLGTQAAPLLGHRQEGIHRRPVEMGSPASGGGVELDSGEGRVRGGRQAAIQDCRRGSHQDDAPFQSRGRRGAFQHLDRRDPGYGPAPVEPQEEIAPAVQGDGPVSHAHLLHAGCAGAAPVESPSAPVRVPGSCHALGEDAPL